jgi:hypothetical protein
MNKQSGLGTRGGLVCSPDLLLDKFLNNVTGKMFIDLTMPRHGLTNLSLGMLIPIVISTMSDKYGA